MFAFANFLLLALFAAAAVDVVLAVRRQGGAKAALGWLWRTDHLLFGGWQAQTRLRLAEPVFAAGLALYEVSVVFCNSMLRETWPWVQGTLSPLLDAAAFACFGAKILLGTRYNWRSLGQAGALYFIVRWVHFNSHNIWFIGIAIAVLAAKDADLSRVMQAFFAAGLAALAAVLVLHFAGIAAPSPYSERVGAYRPAFGYGHPNTFGGLVLGLAAAWAMVRLKKIRWADIGVIAAAGVFLMAGPACRTAALCALLLAALLAVHKLRPGLCARGPVPALCAALVPLEAAVSLILPLFFVKIGPWNTDFGPAWLARLDGVLTNRLSLTWVAYRMYDIKIAGQTLLDWPPLDNSFAYALYQFGPVLALLLAALYAAALYRCARAGQGAALCCLLALLVYAFAECQSFHLTTNPAALLLWGAVYAQRPGTAAEP